MACYLIESSQTAEECLKALDEFGAKGPEALGRFDFGCPAVHTAWATVEAGSESAARNDLPTSLRAKARVIRVGKITAADIAKYHTMH